MSLMDARRSPLGRPAPTPGTPLRPLTLVALGGAAAAAALPPLGLWGLAWLGLAPLWWWVVYGPRITLGAAFGLGLLWSTVYHGLALVWITHLHPLTWMGVPWLGSVAIAAFAWGFVTLWGGVTYGIWAGVMAWVRRRWPRPAWVYGLVGTALWCGLDTLLSWSPLYWPPLALTQSPGNGWILHLSQGPGAMAVTAAIVVVNGGWAWAWGQWRRGQGAGIAVATLGLWVGLQGWGGAIARLAPPDDPSTALTLGLIQGNVPTREKLTPAGVRQAYAAYSQGYRTLVAQGAQGVLTPEGALPEIWRDRPLASHPLVQAVGQGGVPLWLGTFRPVATPYGPALTQSLITLDPQGQVYSQYDKVKLVPLGEYIPFRALLGGVISRLSPVEGSLWPGESPKGLETPLGRAIVGICYESAYGELFRRQAAQGGAWIMTASNNDPYPPAMMAQHHGQDVLRAIESDRWALRATNTGLSGVVTPRGQTQWLGVPHQELTHLATLYRRTTRTPYVRWGDWLTPLLVLGAGLAMVLGRTKERPLG